MSSAYGLEVPSSTKPVHTENMFGSRKKCSENKPLGDSGLQAHVDKSTAIHESITKNTTSNNRTRGSKFEINLLSNGAEPERERAPSRASLVSGASLGTGAPHGLVPLDSTEVWGTFESVHTWRLNRMVSVSYYLLAHT